MPTALLVLTFVNVSSLLQAPKCAPAPVGASNKQECMYAEEKKGGHGIGREGGALISVPRLGALCPEPIASAASTTSLRILASPRKRASPHHSAGSAATWAHSNDTA